MKPRPPWSRICFWLGLIAFLGGALDPLEGVCVILAGSVLLLASARLPHGGLRHPRRWALVSILIATGTAAMLVLSAAGGIGGNTGRSWAWGILILPYPVGWLLGLGTLAAHALARPRRRGV